MTVNSVIDAGSAPVKAIRTYLKYYLPIITIMVFAMDVVHLNIATWTHPFSAHCIQPTHEVTNL